MSLMPPKLKSITVIDFCDENRLFGMKFGDFVTKFLHKGYWL